MTKENLATRLVAVVIAGIVAVAVATSIFGGSSTNTNQMMMPDGQMMNSDQMGSSSSTGSASGSMSDDGSMGNGQMEMGEGE